VGAVTNTETTTEKTGDRITFPLSTIYFYLTEGCNLACRHCWIAPTFQAGDRTYPSLGTDLFRSIITQAKALGLSSVKLTGGEPLLHPQIGELLETIRSEGLRLTVETNGILASPEIAARIATCANPSVSVSLDGADATTHEWVRGVEGSFEAALQGARNLAAAGLRPQIIMTIMRRNHTQMEPLVRLAESLGAASVKFNVVMPTARGERMHEEGETLSMEELVEIGQWVEEKLSASTSLKIHHSHPLAFRPLSKMFGDEGDGCGVCGILGILGVLADGSYALCGIGETVPELIFGNAAEDPLKGVWENNGILNEIRQGMPGRFQGICGECVMKGRCLGSCLAQNYYTNHDLWAGFWYCEEALRKGLFPATRRQPR
jgi:SynChlorMet cassette radical SAM/SPASM protein ScmF